MNNNRYKFITKFLSIRIKLFRILWWNLILILFCVSNLLRFDGEKKYFRNIYLHKSDFSELELRFCPTSVCCQKNHWKFDSIHFIVIRKPYILLWCCLTFHLFIDPKPQEIMLTYKYSGFFFSLRFVCISKTLVHSTWVSIDCCMKPSVSGWHSRNMSMSCQTNIAAYNLSTMQCQSRKYLREKWKFLNFQTKLPWPLVSKCWIEVNIHSRN